MNAIHFRNWGAAIGLVAMVAVVGYLASGGWHGQSEPKEESPAAASDDSKSAAAKIIIGDQAQKNLKLSAQSLTAVVYWKSMTLPGTVVDRPGVSDVEVVAPAIGTVRQVIHAPGDTVRPGETLFRLALTSDTLHETQGNLFKSTQNMGLAYERLKRLVAAGDSVAQARVIEAESEVKQLETAIKTYREQLLNRGLSAVEVEGVAQGRLLNEISVTVPPPLARPETPVTPAVPPSSDPAPLAFELQQLKVEVGQQVEAGQTLCVLSDHQRLAIEGQAFRDEMPLLERSLQEEWPVDVDFQETNAADWPPLEQKLFVNRISNTIDPASRTFGFLVPLENQGKSIARDQGTKQLWRFRAGQKVWLHVRTEKLDNVFVVPTEAVVLDGPEAYVFTQNVNTFERKGVHMLYQSREKTVLANDGSLPIYRKNNEQKTLSAIVQNSAAQLNRMTKAGSSGVPKGYHVHADGSLHKNEDEAK